MENHYAFVCPIKGEETSITHCEQVHNACLRGKAGACEDKLCAVATLAWMCPFRNAVRHMGLWSKPETYPRWNEPRAKPDRLPDMLVQVSLARPMPDLMDYRKAGVPDGIFAEHFNALPKRGAHPTYEHPRAKASAKHFGEKRSRVSKTDPGEEQRSKSDLAPAPRLTLENVGDMGEQMAAAINRRIAEGEPTSAPVSPDTARAGADTRRHDNPAPARTQAAPGGSRPMTLAERAKLMRDKKEAALR